MAGVRDIIHSYVFMVNKCEIITQCLEACYENNLPFDNVYKLIEQVKELVNGTIDDCQKYLKKKDHKEVSWILTNLLSYKAEFEKSHSQVQVAKHIYRDNKRWYDSLDGKRQPWYKQKIKYDKEMAIAFCQNKVEYKISNCSDNKE